MYDPDDEDTAQKEVAEDKISETELEILENELDDVERKKFLYI